MSRRIAHDVIEENHPNTDPVALAWDGNCLAAVIYSGDVAQNLATTLHYRVEQIERDGLEADGGAGGE